MSILDTIIETKRAEVAALYQQQSLEEWREAANAAPNGPSFAKAIATPLSLIAELKKASPSKGIIRDPYHPKEIAQEFETMGASALSVLTDQDYFKGSIEHLKAAKSVVSIPIIRKDFMIDAAQIYEAKVIGASAILLIAAALETETLAELLNVAESVGLDSLVEVHNWEEAEAVMAIPNLKIIGVNNRNLKTFVTDLSIAKGCIRRIKLERPDLIAVAESGYNNVDDLMGAKSAGAEAVLVGEGLATHPGFWAGF